MTLLVLLLLSSISAISLLLFGQSINYYFFQDDWFVLNWINNVDLFSLLSIRSDVIYWRPISMPIFFKINYFLFGLNPAAYHVFAYLIFVGLIVSVFWLFKTIFKNTTTAAIGAFLYATWSIHFLSLSWLSTTSNIIEPLFATLSFTFFLKFTKKQATKPLTFSFLFFLLSLASFEFALMLPFIFMAYSLIYKKTIYSNYIWPFFIVEFIYYIFRFYLFPIPAEGKYQPTFDSQVIKNISWYLLFIFNFPEKYKDLVQTNAPKESIQALISFWQITIPAFLSLAVFVFLFITRLNRIKKELVFGFCWLIFGITPVLFLRDHLYPMYLSFAGLGFIFLALSVFQKVSRKLVLLFLILWLIASFQTLKFNRTNHWAVNQQSIAKAYATLVTEKIKNPDYNAVFIIHDADNTFAKNHNFYLTDEENIVDQSLNGDDAIQVLYNKEALESRFYKKDDPVIVPENRQIHIVRPESK